MSLKRRFLQFVIPSILAMLVFNLYTMVDGIFVAQYVGETALAAVNLSMPYINFIFAFSLLFSIGASTIISIYRGQKNLEKANQVFSQNTLVLSVMALLIMGGCLYFLEDLALFLGANDQTMDYVCHYLGIIVSFSFFFIVSYSLEVLIKADGQPKLATLGVCLGAISNIVLDYVFLAHFQWGIQGAAIATGISQCLTFLVFLRHFLSSRATIRFTRFHLNLSIYRRLVKIGIADFVTELSAGVIVFSFNHVILSIIGTSGVISYTIISYVYNLALMAMVGISQGIQPMVSFYVGKKEPEAVEKIFRYALVMVTIISLLVTTSCVVFAPQLAAVFLDSSNTALFDQTVQAFRIYSLSYAVMGYNVVTSGFCTAQEKPKLALTISIARGLVVILTVLFVLSSVWGAIGIWISPLVSEILCLLISGQLICKTLKNKGAF